MAKLPLWDAIIVGAGPAGLSAALVLARSNRRILICDRGTPRSWASKQMHGFLTRDPISPTEFLTLGRRELRKYKRVIWKRNEVTNAAKAKDGTFRVSFAAGVQQRCRKLLIATGLFDELPKINGIGAFFGSSVFHCPYCDGWEVRGRSLVAYGKRRRGFEMARALTAWSPDVTLCTNGPAGLSSVARIELQSRRIPLIETEIERLIGSGTQINAVALRDGRSIPCAALFFDTPSHPQSSIAEALGCKFTGTGGVRCDKYAQTSIPGVFAAGNITRDVQLAIVAAAEGAKAAFGINLALTREEFDGAK
jgi:thioredoxin reductase